MSATRDSATFFKRAAGHVASLRVIKGSRQDAASCDLAWVRAGWRGRILSCDAPCQIIITDFPHDIMEHSTGSWNSRAAQSSG